MKFSTLLLFLLLHSFSSYSKIKLDVSFEKTSDGYIILAENNEYCPVSVRIDFELENLRSTHGNNRIFLIPANTGRYIITRLLIKDKSKAYSFRYSTTYNYGDHHQNNYAANFAYSLPFKTGSAYSVIQGYKGSFSHQEENALDFAMPIGTEIYAVRDGIVVRTEERYNRNCASKACAKFNNYVTVYHPDGTFAEYTHLRQQGAYVELGDRVEKGDLIGYSGNVGWSTGPHLHLVIYLQKLEERITLETKFLTNQGDSTEFLVKGKIYQREY